MYWINNMKYIHKFVTFEFVGLGHSYRKLLKLATFLKQNNDFQKGDKFLLFTSDMIINHHHVRSLRESNLLELQNHWIFNLKDQYFLYFALKYSFYKFTLINIQLSANVFCALDLFQLNACGITFEGCIMVIVQRPSRLLMLVSKLVEKTPYDHPDFDQLAEVLEVYEKKNVEINELIKAKGVSIIEGNFCELPCRLIKS